MTVWKLMIYNARTFKSGMVAQFSVLQFYWFKIGLASFAKTGCFSAIMLRVAKEPC